MDNFCFMIKSYDLDFDYCQRLVESINEYNYDKIHTYIVVEGIYEKQFQQLANSEISIICLEEIPERFVKTEFDNISAGYINQEIAKLSFWKLNLARNYLCLDSDCKFLRPFYKSDFMYNDNVPYTFLTEDRALQADPNYYATHWVSRKRSLELILEVLEFSPNFLMTCHGMQVMSSSVLEHFETNFLQQRKLEIRNILEISPYEFSWYNFWLQKNFQDNLRIREPNFLTIHSDQMELVLRLQNVSESDIARGYVGVVWNSNYSRGFGVVDGADRRTSSLARLVTFKEIFAVLAKRVKLGFKIKISRLIKSLILNQTDC